MAFDVLYDGDPRLMVPTLLELASYDQRPCGLRLIDDIVRLGNMRAINDKWIRCEQSLDPAPSQVFPSELEFKRVAIFNRHTDLTVNYFYIVSINGEVQYRSRCDEGLNWWGRLKKGFTEIVQHTNHGTNTMTIPTIMEYDPGEEYYMGDGCPQGAGWKVWVYR
jgi:hypothetical protein